MKLYNLYVLDTSTFDEEWANKWPCVEEDYETEGYDLSPVTESIFYWGFAECIHIPVYEDHSEIGGALRC